MPTMTDRLLTCLSCAHHRPERCVQGMGGWPVATLEWCPMRCYLPGSDEREDWDMAALAEQEAA
ncbi:MAG: hypothetical protein MZV65_39730 [Chromatiales bacterium]|nr:hypothetical protein [Chromatiales bacterium]MCK7581167.1 hypothetical protein [Chromatiales bacterium]